MRRSPFLPSLVLCHVLKQKGGGVEAWVEQGAESAAELPPGRTNQVAALHEEKSED